MFKNSTHERRPARRGAGGAGGAAGGAAGALKAMRAAGAMRWAARWAALCAAALAGCWDDPAQCLEGSACGGEERAPAEALPAAHSPRCVDADGPLCLLSAEVDDEEPRRGALTPGERLTLRAVTLVNAQPYPLTLSALGARAQTAGLALDEAGVTLLGAAGEDAESPLEGAGGERAGAEGCAEGVIPPFGACRFPLSVSFTISEDAPVNAEQSALVSVGYEAGAAGGGAAGGGAAGGRASLSLPLLVVDPAAGLRVAAVHFDDSTRDGLLQPGDRLKVREVLLENHSLAPFESLAVHLSPDGEALRLAAGARAVMWEDEGVAVSGLLSSSLVTCPGARLEVEEGEERLAPGTCALSVAGELEVSEGAPVGADALLALRLKARDERVAGAEVVSFEVRPLSVELALDALVVTADEDGDGELAPGERVTFGLLRALNLSGAAVSLRGRVVSGSPLVEVLSGSDLSVAIEGDGFYEGCGGGEGLEGALCEAPIRLRARVSDEAREGDELVFRAELVDQSGARHELEWSARVRRPRVLLELVELTVTQDSLDPRLSGGERGVVSYVKLINTGDADALGLRGVLRAHSPYLTPIGEGAGGAGGAESAEGAGGAGGVSAEWPVELKEMSARVSSGADPMSGDCLSVERSEGAYCYARLSLPFALSPEAPVGEILSFTLELEDALGQSYSIPYELTLY